MTAFLTQLAFLLVGAAVGFLVGVDWAIRRLRPNLAQLREAMVALDRRRTR